MHDHYLLPTSFRDTSNESILWYIKYKSSRGSSRTSPATNGGSFARIGTTPHPTLFSLSHEPTINPSNSSELSSFTQDTICNTSNLFFDIARLLFAT